MSTIAIVQARLASSRFPFKVLAHLGGKPLIAHVVERVCAIEGIDHVVVAMPAEDYRALAAALVEHAPSGVCLMACPGAVDDVLSRFEAVAVAHPADRYMRVTADCPLFAPEIAHELLRQMDLYGYNYATNDTRCSGFPDGMDVQVFTRVLLRRAHLDAPDLYDREHVCPWMERLTTDAYRLTLQSDAGYRPVKLSVDTPEDLERVQAVYEALADKGDFSLKATMAAVIAAGVT